MSAHNEVYVRPGVGKRFIIPIIAYSLIYSLLYLIPNLLPLYTGILIDAGGLNPSSAGWVNTGYLASMTVAALGATFLLTRVSARTLAFIGLGVQAIGFVAPFVLPGTGTVVAAMIVSGLGNGVLFAVANASAAQERFPVLIYGFGIVLSSFASAAIPVPLYAAVGSWGVPGMFFVPLLMIPIIVVSAFVLPKLRLTEAAEALRSVEEAPQKVLTPTAILLLIAIFLINLFNMVFYNFADRALAQAGFDWDAIGAIFTWVYVAAAVGGAIAAIMAKWENKLLSLLILTTALLAIAILIATSTGSQGLLVGSLNAEGLIAMLVISLQLAIAAQIDITGRVAAIASTVLFASWTAGPALGGWALEAFGFGGIFWIAAILGPISIILLVAVHLRRKRETVPASLLDEAHA